MNQLDVALVARSFSAGRAIRCANFRHRRLAADPITLVLWQLGGEPFSAAAIGYGRRRRDLQIAVAGDPRNRDLAFSALLQLARWFNPEFERYAEDREAVFLGDDEFTSARSAPQVVVANGATIEMIGLLGRRLAYLPTDGRKPAPAEIVRLGHHFLFLHRHARMAGQQLIVSLTDLLSQHWATPLSDLEKQSLAALNAYIAPPADVNGFFAAAEQERETLGPVPSGGDDERLEPLVREFHTRRGDRTDNTTIRPLLKPIEIHYRPLVERTWSQTWDARDREAAWPEAASVKRRWDADREAYTRHIDWVSQGGRTRTRQTARQAAVRLQALEDAKARLEAEEACDDPLKMIPYILQNKAVEGRVLRIDADYREMGNARMVRRPLITILSPDPCLMPRGRELWWAGAGDGREYTVHDVQPDAGGGSLVTLKLSTGAGSMQMPRIGSQACFSIHSTGKGWVARLPMTEPWSHRPPPDVAPPAPIEGGGDNAAAS
jgi:hypothetical protein